MAADAVIFGRTALAHRFTTDIDLVDRAMANQITALFQPLFNLISIVLVVTAALPLILVLYIPVLVYWYETSSIYRSTVRELKRTYSEPALGFIIFSDELFCFVLPLSLQLSDRCSCSLEQV